METREPIIEDTLPPKNRSKSQKMRDQLYGEWINNPETDLDEEQYYQQRMGDILELLRLGKI